MPTRKNTTSLKNHMCANTQKYHVVRIQECKKNYTCLEKWSCEIYIRYVCIFGAVEKYTSVLFLDLLISVTCGFSTASVFFAKTYVFFYMPYVFLGPREINTYVFYTTLSKIHTCWKNTYVLKKTPVIFSTTGVFVSKRMYFSYVTYVFLCK